MDPGVMITDSIGYTQEAFLGKWKRYLVLAFLGFPAALLPFVFDPEKVAAGTEFSWEQLPWGEIAILILAGILLSFFLSGYVVRIYRGTIPAPALEDPVRLFLDGIRLQIVMLAWFLPAIIILFGFIGAAVLARPVTGSDPVPALVMLIAGILLACIVMLVVCIFLPVAAVRFARTGSMGEGVNVSAVLEHIRGTGWGTYLVALLVYLGAVLLAGLVISAAGLIPYIGEIFRMGVAPLLAVFSARYYALVYDLNATQTPTP